MLKGLKGILEKGLQIAAPFIGNMLLPGGFGSAIGSGIASLITGNKPKDALMSAGAGFLGGKLFGGSPLAQTTQGKSFTAVRPPLFGSSITDNLAQSGGKTKNLLMDLASKAFEPRGKDGDKPSFGMQAIATGLPAYLSYLAAKEDRDKANVPDASKYMSATDKFYGGQFERPPEERRIQNLTPTYAAAGGMMRREPVNGLKAMEPIQYSAATGQGVMGFAMGGETFPRKTGQIEGPGTKTSDSIPAMLSDGEFVQRTDAVNGAGVMMGAKNAKEAREKGADFMYALQDKLAKMGQKVA
jgi:hypothetical protein